MPQQGHHTSDINEGQPLESNQHHFSLTELNTISWANPWGAKYEHSNEQKQAWWLVL